MSYLLDTNVLSETLREQPSPAVMRWLDAVPDEALHISVLTLGRSAAASMAWRARRAGSD